MMTSYHWEPVLVKGVVGNIPHCDGWEDIDVDEVHKRSRWTAHREKLLIVACNDVPRNEWNASS
jgi:hypothetical protein